MPNDFNPYAAPANFGPAKSSLPTGSWSADDVWRQGNLLVIRKEAELPDRCVKCNAPANGDRLKRALSWHSPLIFALLVISPLIYVIVALIVRQKATVRVGICESHRSRRRNGILVAWVLALAGIALFVVAANVGRDAAVGLLMMLGLILFISGLICGILTSQTVTAKKIDKDFAWIKGCGPEYLEELPDSPT